MVSPQFVWYKKQQTEYTYDPHSLVSFVCVSLFTCSVKGVVGVEDCGEEAEGESTDAERHVKAGVPETLKHLRKKQK